MSPPAAASCYQVATNEEKKEPTLAITAAVERLLLLFLAAWGTINGALAQTKQSDGTIKQ